MIAIARPYTQDFLGWFDDFSTTAAASTRSAPSARGQINFGESLPLAFDGQGHPVPAVPGPVRKDQFKRCPGAAEAARRRRLERARARRAGAARLRRVRARRGERADEAPALDRPSCSPPWRRRSLLARRRRATGQRQAHVQDRLRQRVRPDRGRRLPRRRRQGRHDQRRSRSTSGRAAARRPWSPPRSPSPASATSARTPPATIKPQSLIGEYYVDCQPGTLGGEARHGRHGHDRRRAHHLDDPAGPGQQHPAPALPRAPAADHRRARAPAWPAARRTSRRCSSARTRACARPARRCRSWATRTASSRTSSPTPTRSSASSRRTSRRWRASSTRPARPPRSPPPAARSSARASASCPPSSTSCEPTMARLGELADEQIPLLADLQRRRRRT